MRGGWLTGADTIPALNKKIAVTEIYFFEAAYCKLALLMFNKTPTFMYQLAAEKKPRQSH
jgi:hypothetical protein